MEHMPEIQRCVDTRAQCIGSTVIRKRNDITVDVVKYIKETQLYHDAAKIIIFPFFALKHLTAKFVLNT